VRRVLGLHINNPFDLAELDLVYRTKPVLIHTILDPNKPAGELAQALTNLRNSAGPNCFLTARIWTDDGVAQTRLRQNAPAFGLELATRTKEISRLLAAGVVSAWGSLNEVPSELFTPWSDFQVAFNAVMMFVPVMAYGFASGSSPTDAGQWQTVMKGLVAPNCIAISTHEYWHDDISQPNQGDDGWRQYRVETSQAALIQANPQIAGRIKWAITEIAFTGAIGDGGHGWRNSGLPEGKYADQLRLYATRLSQRDYVIGAAVFCVESSNPDWANTFSVLGAGQLEQVIKTF
jgi:hypothetical protein